MSGAVVVIGASAKPERYAYKAIQMLVDAAYDTIPVHPTLDEVLGLKVRHQLSEIDTAVGTVTLYVNAATSSAMADELIALQPQRVIFNPGTENPQLAAKLQQAGIRYEKACTLVLLRTGQF